MTEDQEKLIPLSEAADAASLSLGHLNLLARTGRIRAQKLGRNWYTSRRAVEAYLQGEASTNVQPAETSPNLPEQILANAPAGTHVALLTKVIAAAVLVAGGFASVYPDKVAELLADFQEPLVN